MSQTAPTPLYARLGLTRREYELVSEANGRSPNDFELAVYSLLWSEHCGYKHSKLLLQGLPSDGPQVLQGPGENAGVIDVGDGLAVAFKVESHNHPSAVEPFQGAATGVGGILRDIFAMGARPIAILDSLRFGELGSARTRHLLDGAVRGIGHYGNCVGVPNVGGEVVFEPGYERNCLVNAMCVGLLRQDRLQTATAAGVGNIVALFGSRTGRDGIGGASVLASADLSDDDDRRPTVQVGDPFTGKKLIECCLELVEAEVLVSLQDLGAAGLASSASEMASRGPVGLVLELDRVPLRETGLEPFEIMISESQERMLAIVEPALLARVEEICRRWDLEFAAIGTIVDGDRLVCRMHDEVVGDMPVGALVDGCPRYPLEPTRPERLASEPVSISGYSQPDDLGETLLRLLAAPNIASKAWVYRQYDQVVGSGTVQRPGGDAGVVRLTPSNRGIAVSLDGNGRKTFLEPRRGGRMAVVEAARNVACTGARPAAITNCLNFGNPERGETPYMLTEAVAGMAEAARALDTPIVSGNVSLYNEHVEGPIPPTPVIGCLGTLTDASRAVPSAFQTTGDAVLWLAPATPAVDGSEYQRTIHGRTEGLPPDVDLEREAALHRLLVRAAAAGLLVSCHDAADGGIAVAIAEAAIGLGLGVELTLPDLAGRPDVTLFGEGAIGVVASSAPGAVADLAALAAAEGIEILHLGRVSGDGRLRLSCGPSQLVAELPRLAAAHAATLPNALDG